MDSKTSSSSGCSFEFISCGMHELDKVCSLNTRPASRTLYKAGLSQKIFNMSSFLTKTRLPLCKAIMFESTSLGVVLFGTAIVICCSLVPTLMIWYSAKYQIKLVKIYTIFQSFFSQRISLTKLWNIIKKEFIIFKTTSSLNFKSFNFVFYDLNQRHVHRLFFRNARFSIDDMKMRMELVERGYPIFDGVNSSSTLFVPPLIATPDLLLHLVVVTFHVFFKHEGLAEVE